MNLGKMIMTDTILIGDVGATNSRFSLWSRKAETSFTLIDGIMYKNANYSTFMDLLQEVMQRYKAYKPIMCSLGVAGPVVDGKCNFTNIDWIISQHELEDSLNIPVTLANDMVAHGETIYCVISRNVQRKDNSIFFTNTIKEKSFVTIAIGTGFGLSQTYKGVTVPTEYGHRKPSIEIPAIIHDYCKSIGSTPTVETILSGKGLALHFLLHLIQVSEDLKSTMIREALQQVLIDLYEANHEIFTKCIIDLGKVFGHPLVTQTSLTDPYDIQETYQSVLRSFALSISEHGGNPSFLINQVSLEEYGTITKSILDTFQNALFSELEEIVYTYLPVDGIYVRGGIGSILNMRLMQNHFQQPKTNRNVKVDYSNIEVAIFEEPIEIGLLSLILHEDNKFK